MSVWKRLITAVKGGANEAAEAVADTQALRILDQEIREAKQELNNSDVALTQIMAKRKLAQQKVESFISSATEYEQHAISASQKGDQAMALDCAKKVMEINEQKDAEQVYVDQFSQSEQTLKHNIDQTKANLRKMEQQVDLVKATESVQRAQAAVSTRHLGANGKMKTAAESLARIQNKQNERQAQMEAASERAASESGDDLTQRLASAGITGNNSSADDELARILAAKT